MWGVTCEFTGAYIVPLIIKKKRDPRGCYRPTAFQSKFFYLGGWSPHNGEQPLEIMKQPRRLNYTPFSTILCFQTCHNIQPHNLRPWLVNGVSACKTKFLKPPTCRLQHLLQYPNLSLMVGKIHVSTASGGQPWQSQRRRRRERGLHST